MDGYYHQQVSMPYFKGAARQRGSGLGSLALAIGRTALPIIRKFVLPAAKRIGKDLIKHGAPEVLEVVSGRKKPKAALKGIAKKTVAKQLGGGAPRKRRTRRKRTRKNKIISNSKRTQRSRADILGKLQ